MKVKHKRPALAARRLKRINEFKDELADLQYSYRNLERKYREMEQKYRKALGEISKLEREASRDFA